MIGRYVKFAPQLMHLEASGWIFGSTIHSKLSFAELLCFELGLCVWALVMLSLIIL